LNEGWCHVSSCRAYAALIKINPSYQSLGLPRFSAARKVATTAKVDASVILARRMPMTASSCPDLRRTTGLVQRRNARPDQMSRTMRRAEAWMPQPDHERAPEPNRHCSDRLNNSDATNRATDSPSGPPSAARRMVTERAERRRRRDRAGRVTRGETKSRSSHQFSGLPRRGVRNRIEPPPGGPTRGCIGLPPAPRCAYFLVEIHNIMKCFLGRIHQ